VQHAEREAVALLAHEVTLTADCEHDIRPRCPRKTSANRKTINRADSANPVWAMNPLSAAADSVTITIAITSL
jgi:hypothetical protein